MADRADLSGLTLDGRFTERRTAADYVAESLREAINSGSLSDGAVLNQVELATHFGVSRIPVREALRQLQAEGLIDLRAHQVAVVRGVDAEELREIYTLRSVIEGWLLEEAAPRITPEIIRQARAINDELALEDDHRKWLLKNAEFHDLLNAPSAARVTIDLLRSLRTRAERYTRIWSKGTDIHRPAETCNEHSRILNLLEVGDITAAAQAAREHVLHTRDQVLQFGLVAGEKKSLS